VNQPIIVLHMTISSVSLNGEQNDIQSKGALYFDVVKINYGILKINLILSTVSVCKPTLTVLVARTGMGSTQGCYWWFQGFHSD
jgi:hypothetical protein